MLTPLDIHNKEFKRSFRGYNEDEIDEFLDRVVTVSYTHLDVYKRQSLRRFAHYDYWSDSVRRSILIDSRADMLVYGMGEKQIKEIALQLNSGIDISLITAVNGTCYLTDSLDILWDYTKIHSFEEVRDNKKMCIRDRTRPLLQGARLTAFELTQDNIPVTLISDNMAGWVMKNKMVDAVIVGADRIAANGDVANKIGTYSVAVLAKEHHIPFYVAAPSSTFDFSLDNGEQIPIEERNKNEVTHVLGTQIAPLEVDVFNPAFDVTPHALIAGIITEYGVLKEDYKMCIRDRSRNSIYYDGYANGNDL